MAHTDTDEAAPKKTKIAPPNINVTPLIDVLLVLMIIFMVVAPLKPAKFETKIPEKPQPTNPNIKVLPPEGLLVVDVTLSGTGPDQTVKLNSTEMSLVDLEARLKNELAKPERATDKAVYIKAPKDKQYGDVAQVIDVVKGAGAQPIGLQIDYLE